MKAINIFLKKEIEDKATEIEAYVVKDYVC